LAFSDTEAAAVSVACSPPETRNTPLKVDAGKGVFCVPETGLEMLVI
jgi:hypothetical protein